MTRYYHIIIFALLGALFLCVLVGRFNIQYFILGAIIAGAGAYIINKDMIIKPSGRKIALYIRHLICLIGDIFISAIVSISNLIKNNKTNIKLITVDDEISSVVIANIITLTPGTVTIDKWGNTLTVLELNDSEEDI